MSDGVAPAGRSGAALAWFAAALLVVLSADLLLKWSAFEYVGDRPVTLVRDWEQAQQRFEASDQSQPRRFVVYDDPRGDLASQPAVVVLPKLLQLKLTTNTGAVFGLGAGQRWIFVAVSLLATGVIGYLFLFSPARAWGHHAALALILAGALGNLHDRVIFGAVRDMLHMLPGVHLPWGLHWPGREGLAGPTEVWPWVFNLADVSLLAGVAGVLWYSWRQPPPEASAPLKSSETSATESV